VAEYRFTEYFEKKVLAKRSYLTKDSAFGLSRRRSALSNKKETDTGSGAPCLSLDGKFLRVITLEDKITIHNAFLDRRFKP
jgi:hypothetical protein